MGLRVVGLRVDGFRVVSWEVVVGLRVVGLDDVIVVGMGVVGFDVGLRVVGVISGEGFILREYLAGMTSLVTPGYSQATAK